MKKKIDDDAMPHSPASSSSGQQQSAPGRMVLDHLRRFVSRHRGLTAVNLSMLLIVPVQEVVVPMLTGRVIDAIRTKRGRSGLMRTMVYVVLTMAVVQIAYMVDDRAEAVLHPRLHSFCYEDMLVNLLRVHEVNSPQEVRTGDVLAQFVKFPVAMTDWFETLKSILPHFLTYVLAIVAFLFIDVTMGLGLFLIVSLTFLTIYFTTVSCSDLSFERDQTQNMMQEQVDEVVRNMPAVYAANTQDTEVGSLRETQERYCRAFIGSADCMMKLKAVMLPLLLVALVAVMYRCNTLVASDRMSVGLFTTVFMVVMYLQASLLRTLLHFRNLIFQWGVIRSCTELLPTATATATATSVPESSIPNPKSGGIGDNDQRRLKRRRSDDDNINTTSVVMLEMRGVTTSTHGVVRIPDFALRRGDRMAVRGPIGCGKSTLLKTLMGFITPQRGSVNLLGRPYATYTVAEIRRTFGYVPQASGLFDRTIMENITYGLGKEDAATVTEDDVWKLASRMGLTEQLRGMHGGDLHSRVEKGGASLSGGQRQIVWLLRVALRRPAVVLLDEPTSALDKQTKEAVVRAIASFDTCIMVTHDEHLVKGAATRVLTFP